MAKQFDDIKDDIYTEEGLEEEVDDDEIRPEEEGLMEGYEGKENIKCAECGKMLSDDEDEVYEEEINDKTYRFCSNFCAEKFVKEINNKIIRGKK
jgi:YHS domain-containing protein